MALRARNPSLSGRATLNPQSTCHGSRPDPNLRVGSGRPPCVPRSREHEERTAAGREKNAEGPKKHTYYIYIYIQVGLASFGNDTVKRAAHYVS